MLCQGRCDDPSYIIVHMVGSQTRQSCFVTVLLRWHQIIHGHGPARDGWLRVDQVPPARDRRRIGGLGTIDPHDIGMQAQRAVLESAASHCWPTQGVYIVISMCKLGVRWLEHHGLERAQIATQWSISPPTVTTPWKNVQCKINWIKRAEMGSFLPHYRIERRKDPLECCPVVASSVLDLCATISSNHSTQVR